MSNDFHFLVRMPHRPERFDVSLEMVIARPERAQGQAAMALLRTQLKFWQAAGIRTVIEEWRQRQIARMFSLLSRENLPICHPQVTGPCGPQQWLETGHHLIAWKYRRTLANAPAFTTDLNSGCQSRVGLYRFSRGR